MFLIPHTITKILFLIINFFVLLSSDESQSLQGARNPSAVSIIQYPALSQQAQVKPQPVAVSAMSSESPQSLNPEPISLVMPLINGSRANETYTAPDPQLDFDGEILGEDFDELLDKVVPSDPAMVNFLSRIKYTTTYQLKDYFY